MDVGGLPLITVRLDADGELEPGGEAMLLGELAAAGASDLLMFCHGWNGWSNGAAGSPAQVFFQAVPSLLERFGTPGRRVALVDVHWPGQRWSDESVPALDRVGVFGLTDSFDHLGVPAPRPPDDVSRWITRSAFGLAQRERVDELLELLLSRPDDSAALKRARVLIRILAEEAPDAGDGERRDVLSILEIDDPYPDQLFADFALRLSELGVVTDPAGGSAGFGDSACRLWHGAQEVVRQITYWQLKRRAAVVGERGLGPLINRLHGQRPDLGISLIGHGLGARTAGYALRGLPSAEVRSVTLLQGAFSHWAFADKLPFDPSSSGALAGVQDRVAGPVVACYSRHDTAVGVFYQLAARAAGPDTAGFETVGHRWGALGHDGHQLAAREFSLNPIGEVYDFARSGLVNIDASWVIGHGSPPCGAHSDICHPELAWIPLNAAGLC